MRTVDASIDPFTHALARVRDIQVRPEFVLEEGPAPQRLAPHALAITAELSDLDDDRASGRFVLLHDPDGVDEWDGNFRTVVFIRAELESDLAEDPMLQAVAWTWLTDALTDVPVTHLGGTVTVTSGQSFGTMSDRPAASTVEIRASWTPLGDDQDAAQSMDQHLQVWLDVLAHAAGMQPLPSDVATLPSRRSRS